MATQDAPQSILLGLDHYGSGNVGDDLMIQGFFEALQSLESSPRLVGLSAYSIEAMRRRFPGVEWLESHRLPPRLECWAGLGATAFQLTCGPWMLDYLENRRGLIESFPRRVLINIGVEAEIAPRRDDFARIASLFDVISTRDQAGQAILSDLGVDRPLLCGGDLANLALAKMVWDFQPPDFNLGMILAGDTLSRADLQAAHAFLERHPGRVCLIANETRAIPGAERDIYRQWNARRWFGRRILLVIPPYLQGSLQELVAPIAACQTILSARYHGLLTAAWAGCRVGAISRSSKLRALAVELGIPYVEPPLTCEALRELERRAQVIPRSRLEPLATAALEGVRQTLCWNAPVSDPVTDPV